MLVTFSKQSVWWESVVHVSQSEVGICCPDSLSVQCRWFLRPFWKITQNRTQWVPGGTLLACPLSPTKHANRLGSILPACSERWPISTARKRWNCESPDGGNVQWAWNPLTSFLLANYDTSARSITTAKKDFCKNPLVEQLKLFRVKPTLPLALPACSLACTPLCSFPRCAPTEAMAIRKPSDKISTTTHLLCRCAIWKQQRNWGFFHVDQLLLFAVLLWSWWRLWIRKGVL